MNDHTPINGQFDHRNIPNIVIGRLPIYLRALERMAAQGQEICSSHEFGQRLGISSAQIRKDLSQFGEFGKQGIGYRISYLIDQLMQILKVNRRWDVALVGAGNLGRAIARSNGFSERGFHIVAVYDTDPAKIGQELNDIEVKSADNMVADIQQQGIKMVLLAVPANHAQGVADKLVAAGVQGILNYAPVNLVVPGNVQVQYIDPVIHLQRMTYYIDIDEDDETITLNDQGSSQ